MLQSIKLVNIPLCHAGIYLVFLFKGSSLYSVAVLPVFDIEVRILFYLPSSSS